MNNWSPRLNTLPTQRGVGKEEKSHLTTADAPSCEPRYHTVVKQTFQKPSRRQRGTTVLWCNNERWSSTSVRRDIKSLINIWMSNIRMSSMLSWHQKLSHPWTMDLRYERKTPRNSFDYFSQSACKKRGLTIQASNSNLDGWADTTEHQNGKVLARHALHKARPNGEALGSFLHLSSILAWCPMWTATTDLYNVARGTEIGDSLMWLHS